MSIWKGVYPGGGLAEDEAMNPGDGTGIASLVEVRTGSLLSR
jgi:hypothetical protein